MNIKWNYKIIYKTKYKILIYRDTRQPVSTSKMQQKTPRKSNISAKDTAGRWLAFLPKNSLPQTSSPHPTSKNQPTDFSTNGALELIKIC